MKMDSRRDLGSQEDYMRTNPPRRPLMRKGDCVVMLVPGCNGNQDTGILEYDESPHCDMIQLRRADGKLVGAMTWEVAPLPKLPEEA